MKCAMFVALLLATATAFADDKPAKEPAALVKAREIYEAKVKAAVDPIKVAYLKHLDEMKKAYGAKGDLESALAVQKEIESMTSEKATAKHKAPITIVGNWIWASERANVEFKENGTATYDGKGQSNSGKWTCLDKKTHKYSVSWSNGDTNWLLLSSDGANIKDAKSGQPFAKRVATDEDK